MISRFIPAALLLLAQMPAHAADVPPTARELGLMIGSPPPADRQVTIENFMVPPYNRWGLRHLRELVPTRPVPTGDTVAPLPMSPVDLSALVVTFPDGRNAEVGEWLESAYTDGFLVLHHGKIVYERYYNDETQATQHLMFSVTKSFTGTMLLTLIEQGRVGQESACRAFAAIQLRDQTIDIARCGRHRPREVVVRQ